MHYMYQNACSFKVVKRGVLVHFMCLAFVTTNLFSHLKMRMYMLWFNVILDSISISLCFCVQCMVMYDSEYKTRENKNRLEPRIKLNYGVYNVIINFCSREIW